MVAFAIACRRAGNVRLIPWEEILREKCPQETQAARHPKTWRVHIEQHGSLGITPDAIFGLHYLDQPDGKNKAFFFLEADRGTMPVFRKSLKTTSFYRKLAIYHATHAQGVHTKQFGIKTFRVLTVTTGAKRIRSIVTAVQRLQGLQGLFLFAAEGAVTRGDPLATGWRNGREIGVELES